jgi:hypothetical protein
LQGSIQTETTVVQIGRRGGHRLDIHA